MTLHPETAPPTASPTASSTAHAASIVLAPPSEAGAAPRVWALVPCAGSGSRAGTALAKQYEAVAGRPLVMHTLAAFAQVPAIVKTLVVVAPDDDFLAGLPSQDLSTDLSQDLSQDLSHQPSQSPSHPPFHPVVTFIIANCGGRTRANSVFNGLKHLLTLGATDSDWVLVHDAARCLITPAQISALISACLGDSVGGLLAIKLADTLKSEFAGRVASTVERSDKWLAQTPQMFRIGPLMAALVHAGDAVTDEASAMEMMGSKPRLLPGSAQNFKVTYPEDFALAEAVLVARQQPAPAKPPATARALPRIGEGWDIHALVAGRKLIIGGIYIPFNRGLLGHSDADVLLHAITDALLGAASLGDIGTHFPDTDAQFKGADSCVLLAETARRVRAAGFEIGNVDSTVIAQAPRLAPHIGAMCACIADVLGVALTQVNVKAKTAEKMGPVGEGLAIEARAMVLVWC